MALNYEHSDIANSYYTARLSDDVGVCISSWVGDVWFVQLFPWHLRDSTVGYAVYFEWIMSKVKTDGCFLDGTLFSHWPYIVIENNPDMLTLKCIIEDAHSRLIEHRKEHKA